LPQGPLHQIRAQIEKTTSDYNREKLQSGSQIWRAAPR